MVVIIVRGIVGGSSFYCFLSDVALNPTHYWRGEGPTHYWCAVLVMLVLVVIVMCGSSNGIIMVMGASGGLVLVMGASAGISMVLVWVLFVFMRLTCVFLAASNHLPKPSPLSRSSLFIITCFSLLGLTLI